MVAAGDEFESIRAVQFEGLCIVLSIVGLREFNPLCETERKLSKIIMFLLSL